jgi:hypothetical protein
MPVSTRERITTPMRKVKMKGMVMREKGRTKMRKRTMKSAWRLRNPSRSQRRERRPTRRWIMARIVIDLRSEKLGYGCIGTQELFGLYRLGSVFAGSRNGYKHSKILVDLKFLYAEQLRRALLLISLNQSLSGRPDTPGHIDH